MPAPIFHYLDGGADDEWSLANNNKAFDDYALMPRQLNDVSRIDLSTRLLGQAVDLPLILSPTGMTRLFHHAREPAVARAAENFNIFYGLSTLATTSLEDIAATVTSPILFQIYVLKDRALMRDFIDRCKAAGIAALCLTVDTVIAGNRERDRRTGMLMPPRFTLASLASFAAHPYWSLNLLCHPDFRLANVTHRQDGLGSGAMGLIDYVNSQFDPKLTWDDAAWIAEQWGEPFVIKGLLSADDARRAVDVGATAVMISNHGGRQLDATPAPIDCVAPMRAAVGDKLELIVDGGVRRGTHVIKALALGADAVAFGRPYLYALAAGGQAGVEQMLSLFAAEVERAMTLLGCASLSDIGIRHLFQDGSSVRPDR